jgi:hypothetical protein
VKYLATLALMALPMAAQAQDYTEDQLVAFVAAFMANGCTMTEDEAVELMPEAGFDQETSALIANDLIDQGLATAGEDVNSLTLSAEICE